MSTSSVFRLKARQHVRFYVSAAVSLTLAGLMVWGLVKVYEPQSKLDIFNIRRINETHAKLYLELQVINQNYFRGYNYTGGWIEPFYVHESDNASWDLSFEYVQPEYQGFRKTLNRNVTLILGQSKMDWELYPPLLKNRESHIYVSVYLSYYYKILFWTTHKQYYQWLDAKVYLNGNLDLQKPADFNRTKNFVLAF